MEVVSAIAPGATQKIYIGPNTGQGVLDTYNKIVTDNTAKTISTSWGLCESLSGDSFLNALDTIFAQSVAQGQAVFAASGDYGAYDCRDGVTLDVDSPASDPHVVGVGGTRLTVGAGGSYNCESVWSNNPYGVGGGLSSLFARPGYQNGPGVNNLYPNGKRQAPDVSADADPGYSVYCTAGSNCGGAGWIEVGGTSAGAPLWAALAADVNQYLAANSQPRLGSASAALYAFFNATQQYRAYHDIVAGSNLHYLTTTGYDQASGVGTPDVWNLARDAAVWLGAVSIATGMSEYNTAQPMQVTIYNLMNQPIYAFDTKANCSALDLQLQVGPVWQPPSQAPCPLRRAADYDRGWGNLHGAHSRQHPHWRAQRVHARALPAGAAVRLVTHDHQHHRLLCVGHSVLVNCSLCG